MDGWIKLKLVNQLNGKYIKSKNLIKFQIFIIIYLFIDIINTTASFPELWKRIFTCVSNRIIITWKLYFSIYLMQSFCVMHPGPPFALRWGLLKRGSAPSGFSPLSPVPGLPPLPAGIGTKIHDTTCKSGPKLSSTTRFTSFFNCICFLRTLPAFASCMNIIPLRVFVSSGNTCSAMSSKGVECT